MAKYKSKAKDSQLIVNVQLKRKEKINDREFDHFCRKYIRGFLDAKRKGKNKIIYSGPRGISLYEKLKGPITRHEFFLIIEQIINIKQLSYKNGLSLNKIVLDIRNIFINEYTKEMQFIYLPIDMAKEDGKFMELIDEIVYSTIPLDETDTDFVYKFVNYLRTLKNNDIKQIEKYILKEDRNAVYIFANSDLKDDLADNSHGNNPQSYDYYSANEADTGIMQETEDTDYFDANTGILDEDATGYLGDEDTGYMGDDNVNGQTSYPKLYRLLTDEMIVINKPVFRLGKEKSYADYFVSNNGAVSRNHADIIIRGNRYFVMDLNSKNRTFINERVIPVRQETEIFDGDRLKLANEEFIFHAA